MWLFIYVLTRLVYIQVIDRAIEIANNSQEKKFVVEILEDDCSAKV